MHLIVFLQSTLSDWQIQCPNCYTEYKFTTEEPEHVSESLSKIVKPSAVRGPCLPCCAASLNNGRARSNAKDSGMGCPSAANVKTCIIISFTAMA